jgi:hypothetical protein|tara:strand:- start:321 stop:632 length:312 start_codon:yes stop_codon:yes gene_type:complete
VDGSLSEKHETARSYRTAIIDDNAVVSLNLKWLGQIIILVGMLVYGYWRIETRIRDLESNFEEANIKIQELVEKHIVDEQARYEEMEEELKWYQKLTSKKKKK